MNRSTSNTLATYGWGQFYEDVYGPDQSAKNMLLEILKTQDRPVTVKQLKRILDQSSMPIGKFGTRYTYLYHLSRRLIRAGVLGMEVDGGLYLTG